MKVPDSGMPEETYWESLLDVSLILDRLGVERPMRDVIELGCGYGTFTLPVATRIAGTVHAIDIDPLMTERTALRALEARLANIEVVVRDVVAKGFGMPGAACDACLLFNILHFPEAAALVAEAARIVRPGGKVLVIHWRSDIPTPRGPAVEVRPRYAQISGWAGAAGLDAGPAIYLPPWHIGAVLTRPNVG